MRAFAYQGLFLEGQNACNPSLEEICQLKFLSPRRRVAVT